MIPELQTALVIIVFAGGPHTPTRYALFQERMTQLNPDAVYLTGADFAPHHAQRVERTPVFTDDCGTTITSCFSLARRLNARYPAGARLLVITSNYHAPRVAWLLRGVVPRRTTVRIETSRDMTREGLCTDPRLRRLLRGEMISWLYCFPAGLLLRPLPTGLLVLLAAGLMVRRRRHRDHND